MKPFAAAFSALALTACVAGPVGNPHPPQPAKTVDLERYAGRWYEVARYDMRFEGSGRYLWLLSRKLPTQADRAALTARAKALGYDVSLLRPTKQPAP
jgi:lipocalin